MSKKRKKKKKNQQKTIDIFKKRKRVCFTFAKPSLCNHFVSFSFSFVFFRRHVYCNLFCSLNIALGSWFTAYLLVRGKIGKVARIPKPLICFRHMSNFIFIFPDMHGCLISFVFVLGFSVIPFRLFVLNYLACLFAICCSQPIFVSLLAFFFLLYFDLLSDWKSHETC